MDCQILSTADSGFPIKIGHFTIHGADKPSFDVYTGFDMHIGRNSDKCYPSFNDPTVSEWHLKLYSIIHDKNGKSGIEPLLYAEDLSTNGTYWNGTLIGKANGGFLISDGDKLSISPSITLTFHAEYPHEKTVGDPLQRSEMRCFKDTYRISQRKLGHGVHGQVHMAIHKTLGYQVACKIVNLRRAGEEEKERVESSYTFQNATIKHGTDPQTTRALLPCSAEASKRRVAEASDNRFREINILKDLSHPNIIRLEKVYYTDNTIYIFEELVSAGDLFSFLEHKGGSLDESCTAVIVRQVLEALSCIHDQNIVHRDVKPENILIASLGDAKRVVLTDFGAAIKFSPTGVRKHKVKRIQSRNVGTMEYAAPEIGGWNPVVKVRGYTKAVDLWSLGCVTATLLVGTTPFSSLRTPTDRRTSYEVIMEAAAECDLTRLNSFEQWRLASWEAKDFVQRLLVLDETVRMTAAEALHHKWYEDWRTLFDGVYKFSLKNYRQRNQVPNIVERIDPQAAARKTTKEVGRVKKSHTKTYKPIEAHYKPYHRHIDQLLAPPRARPALPPIAEEPTELPDKRKKAGYSERMAALPHTIKDGEPPAVKNLHIVGSLLSSGKRFDILDWEPSEQSTGIHESFSVDLAADPAGPIMTADTSASVEDISPGSLLRVLAENSSKANQGIMPEESSSDMDLSDVPKTPSKSRLRKPAASTRASPLSWRKRKRFNVFDFEDDDEEQEKEDETHQEDIPRDNAHMYSISFTPINHREPMQLGDLERTSLDSVVPPLEELVRPARGATTIFGRYRPVGKGHDGPLQSKLDPQLSSKKSEGNGKCPFHNTYAPTTQDSSLLLPAESQNLVPRTPPHPQRHSSMFDWDEHTEASTANRSFCSARSLALSVERRRARRAADLSDSIRTAHD